MTRKLIFAIISLLFFATATQAAGDKKEKRASIVLDSTVTNIGTFPKNASTKTVVFTFKNAGNDKLVFYDVAPDCGCVTVQLPEKPVKPGKKGKIIITYKGLNKKPGKVNHRINFACSGTPAHFHLRVVGRMTEK